MKHGGEAFERLVRDYEFGTVLDVGSGAGEHTARFRQQGKSAVSLDRRRKADIQGDYLAVACDEQFDAIWCSHVLEHQLEPHRFLQKLRADLKDGGILVLTIPPLKMALVGGHVSLWTEGLLIYHLVLAGWDCAQARVGVYGYNISVIVERRDAELPALNMANGDLEKLSAFFPVAAAQNMTGQFGNLRW